MKTVRNRIVNVTLLTVLLIASILVFGYAFGAIRELNAMDLSHTSARELGSEFTYTSEDPKGVDSDIVNEAEAAEDYIEKSMLSSGFLCDVSINYTDQLMVCKIYIDGTADAIADGNTAKWQEICELANSTSAKWQDGLAECGLDGWHFSLVIANDYNMKNALCVSTDGQIIYDCSIEEATTAA